MKTAIFVYDNFFVPVVKKNFFSDWQGISVKDGDVETWSTEQNILKRCRCNSIDSAKFSIDCYLDLNKPKSKSIKTIFYP